MSEQAKCLLVNAFLRKMQPGKVVNKSDTFSDGDVQTEGIFGLETN